MESEKAQIKKIKEVILQVLIWTFYAVLIGAVVGAVGFAFDKCLEFCTEFRTQHDFMLLLLPVAGLLIVGLYNLLGVREPLGTNRVLLAVHQGDQVALRVAPMIFISTALTHICGGSAGREGAALQLGGSIASFLGRKLGFAKPDTRVITMCGMAAGFSALFGTPLASSIFAMEVAANEISYATLYPCLLSALTAKLTAGLLGGEATSFSITAFPQFTILTVGKVMLAALIIALVSIVFINALHMAASLYAKYFETPYLRILIGALAIILLSFAVGNRDYNGAGMDVIRRAVAGNAVWYGFLLKIVFTALTLGAGFKGGEIVPTFYVGSTLGCVIGPLLGLPAGFCAGLGMIAMFCAVTNCPLASMFLAYELFGGEGLILFAVACAVSYVVSGDYSLYAAQKLQYSKLYFRKKNREEDASHEHA